MDLEAYKLELHLNEPISNATLDLKKIIMLYVHAKLIGSENTEDSLAIFLELPAKGKY